MTKTFDMMERIYDAALQDCLLDTILDVFAQRLPRTTVLLFGHDTTHPSGNFLLHRGLDADAVVAYVASLSVDNPWLGQRWLQKVGSVYQDQDLMADVQPMASAKTTKWDALMRPSDHVTGMVLNRSGTRQLVLEVRYPEATEAKSRRDATELLETLGPHLLMATKIMHLKGSVPAGQQLTSDVIELIPSPVLIIDTECQIHGMNERADIMADQMDAFFISADGVFHATDLDSELELRQVVQRLGSTPQSRSEVLSLSGADKSKRVFISLKRMGVNAKRIPSYQCAHEKQTARLALVIQDASEPLRLSHRALWNTFNLTNAEAELASMLLDGCSIGDCAQKQNLAKQTLRNHLGSIMKKTGTHRQPQLVALLTRLALTATL